MKKTLRREEEFLVVGLAEAQFQALASFGRKRDTGVALEQRPRRRGIEPAELELGEPGRLEATNLSFAGGEEHHDPLRLQPPGDEGERVRRSVVEPLRIIDQAEKRAPLGRLRQQAQDRQGNEKAVVARTRLQAKRPPQGARLRFRKRLEIAKNGPDELVQGGEGKLCLRLDPAAAEHLHPGGSLACIREQSRLTGPRLTADDKHATTRLARTIEKRTDTEAFYVSAVKQRLDRNPPPPPDRFARPRAYAGSP